MTNVRERKPSPGQSRHAVPSHVPRLAPPLQRDMPETHEREPKRTEARAIAGHAVVARVSLDDRAQVGSLFWYGRVQASPQLVLTCCSFPCHLRRIV